MPELNYDTYVEDTRAAMAVARDEEAEQSFESEVNQGETGSSFGAGLWGWTKKLPHNIRVATARATLNTIEATYGAAEAAGEFVLSGLDSSNRGTEGASGGRNNPDRDPAKAPQAKDLDLNMVPSIKTVFPGVFEATHNFLDGVTAQNTVADDITQGVMQFAIPFTGYLKALGGIDKTMKLVSAGRLALAEGVAAATAFEAHEGRVSDLFEMGRQMDNGFARVLNQVSPDGSLVNSYINWMIDRENEGEWEGRFKNAVDSLVTTAGLAGFLKSAAVGLRTAKRLSGEIGTRSSRNLQRGSIGFEDELNDIERARALKNTEVEEIEGEHIVLEGDDLNVEADVIPIKKETE